MRGASRGSEEVAATAPFQAIDSGFGSYRRRNGHPALDPSRGRSAIGRTRGQLMREALIRSRRVVLDPLAWYLSRRELRGLMREDSASVPSVVDATERYTGRGFYARIHAVQRTSEIMALAELVKAARPKVIVEVGTDKGGTLYIWSRTNPDAELIVSIDLPE